MIEPTTNAESPELCKTKEEFKEKYKDYKPRPNLKDLLLTCKLCKKYKTDKCLYNDSPQTCGGFENNKNISDTDKLTRILEGLEKIYYTDQYGTAYVWLNDDGIYKNYKIESQDFKLFLNKISLLTLDKSLNREKLKDAELTFQTLASIGDKKTIKSRVFKTKNIIYVDLCNDKWQSVKITPEGYTIQKKTESMFKRFQHMKALPTPKMKDTNCNNTGLLHPPSVEQNTLNHKVGGKTLTLQSFKPLEAFINLDEKDFFLTLCHLVNTFFVDRPQTTISINGEKGSGKSQVSEIAKKLLDPSITLTLDLPKNTNEIIQILDHNHYPCFDNVSYISHEVSDIFCRANTGSGNSKRKLYSDDSEFNRSFLKSININGINNVVVREDLLDRTILIKALKFNGNRKTEKQLETEFNEVYPNLQHELYSLVSKVLALLPEIKAPNQFRMMDFAKVGCATAKALGKTEQYFINVYTEKLNNQILEAIYNDVFGNVLLSFIENRKEWKGSATDLHIELMDFAKALKVSTRIKQYPKASNIMSRKINDLSDAFGKIGIELISGSDPKTRVSTWTIINHNFDNKIKCAKCGKELAENEYVTCSDTKKRCVGCVMSFKKGVS